MKLNKFGYPKIENEEQYWEEYEKWKKKFKQVNSFKQLSKDPFGYMAKLEEVLREGVERDLIEREYYNKKMEQIARETSNPERFKGDIRKGKQHIKNKAKEFFGKKKNKDNEGLG